MIYIILYSKGYNFLYQLVKGDLVPVYTCNCNGYSNKSLHILFEHIYQHADGSPFRVVRKVITL